VEEYDPVMNVWRARASMAVGRVGPGIAAVNGKIYVMGGSVGSSDATRQAVASVEEYDVATNTWTTKASMPIASVFPAALLASNGRIYVIGGANSATGVLDTVQEYDPAMNTWTTRAPMPTGRWSLSAVQSSNGKIYAIGGNRNGALRTVEAFDPPQ
jgi:N-acetylneuraminic acid mutarotase